MRILTVAVGALMALGSTAAFAADPAIYSSVPNMTGSWQSAWCSDCYGGGTFEPLDQFTLGSSASITSLDLSEAALTTGSFTFEVYNSDHSSILFSQAISATDILDENGISVFHGSVTGLTLAAGTYWAGFIAPSLALPGLSGGNGSLIDTVPHTGNALFPLGGNSGYTFYGTAASSPTPEPASWAMMLGGFGAIGGAMRSRRKAAVRFA